MLPWRSINGFIVFSAFQKTGMIAAELMKLGFSHPYASWSTVMHLSLSQLSPQPVCSPLLLWNITWSSDIISSFFCTYFLPCRGRVSLCYAHFPAKPVLTHWPICPSWLTIRPGRREQINQDIFKKSVSIQLENPAPWTSVAEISLYKTSSDEASPSNYLASSCP